MQKGGYSYFDYAEIKLENNIELVFHWIYSSKVAMKLQIRVNKYVFLFRKFVV